MRRVTEFDPIALDDLRVLAQAGFGDMIKGVDDAATRAAIAVFVARVVRR